MKNRTAERIMSNWDKGNRTDAALETFLIFVGAIGCTLTFVVFCVLLIEAFLTQCYLR